jgi:hypothetical protein
MLILYGSGNEIFFRREHADCIRVYPYDHENRRNKAFIFSDGTTVTVEKSLKRGLFYFEVLKEGESFISVQSEINKYGSDVVYVGNNMQWLVFGDITYREKR